MYNGIAIFIKKIGTFTWILGFIVGILMGNMEITSYGVELDFDNGEFIWSEAIIYWISALVAGALLYGFAEAIELLDKMNDKMLDVTSKLYYVKDDLKAVKEEVQKNNEIK